jgi:WD40 repeat protein
LIGYRESIDSLLNYEVWDLANSPVGAPQKIYSNKTRQNIPSISKDGNLILFGSSLMSTYSAVLFGTWNGYDAVGYNVTTYDGYGKLVFGGGGGGGESIGSTKKDYAVDAFTIEDITNDPSIRPLSLRGHESNISTSQISPDEKLILTYSGAAQDDGGAAENLLRLWEINKMRADPTTKGVILPLTLGKDIYVQTLAFSPDSRWIFVIDSNNTIHYFPTSIETLEKQACAVVGRNFIISEWERFFPNEKYRKTCDSLPEHPSAISQ